MPQLTEDQMAKFDSAMSAYEAIKSDIMPLKGKLDAFDAKKFDDLSQDVLKGLDASEQVKALKAAQDDFAAKQALIEEKGRQLEAALNRPVIAVTDESKAKETAALGTKLFNQFARKRGEGQTYFDEYFDAVKAVGDHTLADAERKALSVNSDPNGGYLVTPEFGGIVQQQVYETSPLRQLATVAQIGTDSIEYLTDNDQAGWNWVGETQARPDTSTPVLGAIRVNVNELEAMPNVTQKLIDDATIDIENWVAMKVAEVFSRGEATAFISGNGVNKPMGILSYAAGTSVPQMQVQQVPLGSVSAFTYTGMLALMGALKEPYQKNATFLTQRASMQLLLGVVDGQGRPIFNPDYTRNSSMEGYVMGQPVRFANDLPSVAANALAIAYGDWKKSYLIVDRFGIRVLRDPYTNKPYVRFYTTKRVGGGVINPEAYKLGKFSVS